jgi:hypothetical protein
MTQLSFIPVTARVGLRFVTEHHVLTSDRESTKALRKVTSMFPSDGDEEGLVGCIQSNCDLVKETHNVSSTHNLYPFDEYYTVC